MDNGGLTYYDTTANATMEIGLVPDDTRKREILQPFYAQISRALSDKLSLRYSAPDKSLVLREGNQWKTFTIKEQNEFWQAVWEQWGELRDVNWSTDRLNKMFTYFFSYPNKLKFKSHQYFELKNFILDVTTGELHKEPNRHLLYPTFRNTPYSYRPGTNPSVAWQKWYDTMTPEQKRIREWSVASAMCGEYGALLTFGNTRTGKSTLAEGLSKIIGEGARPFSVSRDWGRFQTKQFHNTTYLFDPDAKGSKGQNLRNYEQVHQMMSGDPIQMEIKGGLLFESTNYGFMEIISNDPVGLTFEPSLVDRVRFCLYTYITPRGDGGGLKRRILADEQAWVNYAVECAIKLAKGEIERSPLDHYQALGWYHWLSHNNGYAKLCFTHGRYLTYQEYDTEYRGSSYYKMARDSVQTTRDGMEEISRQLEANFVNIDWDEYEEQLRKEYYGK